MDPTLVLTDEQKKTRFRKMIDKKGGPSDSPITSPNSVTAASSSRSNPNILVQEPKQPRVESGSSRIESSSRRTEFKLHTTETRFGGQIRRSRTVDSVISPFISSKEVPRSRRFSGNKISTSRKTDNINFEPIGKYYFMNHYIVSTNRKKGVFLFVI